MRDDGVDVAAILVTAGQGTTLHRRDCPLVAQRDDLRAVGEDAASQPAGGLTPCRVCKP